MLNIEIDWINWLTFSATAANVIAVVAMMIHAAYLRRKEKISGKRAGIDRRD